MLTFYVIENSYVATIAWFFIIFLHGVLIFEQAYFLYSYYNYSYLHSFSYSYMFLSYSLSLLFTFKAIHSENKLQYLLLTWILLHIGPAILSTYLYLKSKDRHMLFDITYGFTLTCFALYLVILFTLQCNIYRRRIQQFLRSEPLLSQDCSICLEGLRETVVRIRKCDHAFHRHCLERWLKNNTSCPMCRELI